MGTRKNSRRSNTKKRSGHKKSQRVWKMKGCARKRRSIGRQRGGNCHACSFSNLFKGGYVRPQDIPTCKVCGSGCRCRKGCRCHPNCPGNCYLKSGRGKRGGCGCDTFSSVKQMGGTASLLTSGASVAPFVGGTWTPEVKTWPGVQGIPGVPNHYGQYDISKDPSLQPISGRDGQIYPQSIFKGGRKGKNKTRKMGGGIIPQDMTNAGRNMMYGLGSTWNSLAGYPAPVNPLPYKDQLMHTNRIKY